LYQKEKVSRIYYSSFNPFNNTPLENLPPSPPLREFRLYQASFLLRDYGFSAEDLIYQESGNLLLDKDPKLAWAENHLLHQPLEINTAPRQKLLQIPGIGPARANAILSLRRARRFNSFSTLIKKKLLTPSSARFILVDGKSPAQQIRLF
jgi:predicted DNA-binding helix-hairpin-helix protein